jgi:predicted amidophosphoribosyltransferase
MSDQLSSIPPRLRVEDICDYCRRQFVRARGIAAICPSCGLENERMQPESSMLVPAAEKAIKPQPVPKPRKPRKSTK